MLPMQPVNRAKRAKKHRDRSDGSEMAPKDEWHLAYFIFFWLGAGFLFPWNAFISGVDYFADLYPTAHIDYVFAIAYMVPNLLTLVFLMAFAREYSSRARISLGFVLFLALISLVPLLDLLTLRGGQGTALSLTLTVGAVVASGTIDAIIQGSLFGIAGELPERYTQALVGGTSASGVIISLARIVTKASLPNTPTGLRTSANIYFGISSFFVGLCILGFHSLHKLPVMKFYQERKAIHVVSLLRGDSEGPSSTSMAMEDGDGPSINAPEVAPSQPDAFLLQPEPNAMERLFKSDGLTSEGHAMALHTNPKSDYRDVFRHIWVYPCTLTLIYIVTLSIFPGFISEGVRSEALGDWYPVLLMAAFNLTDFLGKMTPTFWRVYDTKILVGGALLRLLFYPLYGLCVFGPAFLRMEPIVFVMTMCLGFSNGLFTSWLMMIAPAKVSLENSEAAGFIMVLFLILGLFFGSAAGWLWILIL